MQSYILQRQHIGGDETSSLSWTWHHIIISAMEIIIRLGLVASSHCLL